MALSFHFRSISVIAALLNSSFEIQNILRTTTILIRDGSNNIKFYFAEYIEWNNLNSTFLNRKKNRKNNVTYLLDC